MVSKMEKLEIVLVLKNVVEGHLEVEVAHESVIVRGLVRVPETIIVVDTDEAVEIEMVMVMVEDMTVVMNAGAEDDTGTETIETTITAAIGIDVIDGLDEVEVLRDDVRVATIRHILFVTISNKLISHTRRCHKANVWVCFFYLLKVWWVLSCCFTALDHTCPSNWVHDNIITVLCLCRRTVCRSPNTTRKSLKLLISSIVETLVSFIMSTLFLLKAHHAQTCETEMMKNTKIGFNQTTVRRGQSMSTEA